MTRARVIVLAIAIAAAGGAALLAKGFLGKTKVEQVVKTDYDTVKVLVANKDIQLGDTIDAGEMRWQDWPRDAATGSYVTRDRQPNAKSDFSGAMARAPFLSGEPIKEQKLIKASDGGVMAAILPSGMRAVSTPIKEESAAGLFILPNDRVDVILTRRMRGQGGRGEDYVSDTLFRNVKVLAIGQAIDTKGGEKTASGRTATLELTPRQAETLSLARSMAGADGISLSLRSLADSRPSGGENDGREVLSNERGSSVKMLKYGVSSRQYGIN